MIVLLPNIVNTRCVSLSNQKCMTQPTLINLPGLPNFKKAMAILVLALANYLLDIVSSRGPNMVGARGEILCFGVPRWPKNAFPSLVPWTNHCAKALHFLYYVPQNIYLPASLKNPDQLLVQMSVTSNDTVLNSRFYRRGWRTQGVLGHLIKT